MAFGPRRVSLATRSTTAATLALALAAAAHAQQRPPVQTGQPERGFALCSLLTNPEVERLTARKLYDDPEPWTAGGGRGCTWGGGEAQVMVFDGDQAEARWEAFLRGFKHADERRHPVPGIGDRAYALYTSPRTQYQDAAGFLVVPRRAQVVVVSAIRDPKRPTAEVEAMLVALARPVLAKLP
jgi:hypothetical protein